jgi:hypothetical protein
MAKKVPTLDEVITALDCRNESDTGRNQILLHEKYGLDVLVPFYIAAFPRIKNWIGRKYVMFWIERYARRNPDVVKLARFALNDKSWKVRHDACSTLAYALDTESLPFLRELLKHKKKETRDDAAAAIDAIENRNHNYFVDRQHAGNIFFDPGRIDWEPDVVERKRE